MARPAKLPDGEAIYDYEYVKEGQDNFRRATRKRWDEGWELAQMIMLRSGGSRLVFKRRRKTKPSKV